jgi:hypothetical protein
MKTKQEDVKGNNAKISLVWASALVAMTAIISGAFGSEGFRWAGIAIGLIIIIGFIYAIIVAST